MVKRFIIIISILSIYSCSSRKVNVSKTNDSIKVDSSLTVKTDGTYVKNNNVFIDESIDEVEYKPIDSIKPMFINNVEFKNVTIKTKKYLKKTIDTTKVLVKVNKQEKLVLKKETKKATYVKNIDKKPNYYILILLGIVALFIYSLWNKRSYILKLLHL